MDSLVAGVDFSGANKVPNDTWIATGRLSDWQFQTVEVKKVGSHGLAAELNKMQGVTAVGVDCPFSLPTDFISFLAQRALKPDFQSWQEVAEHLVFMPFEEFMTAVVEFKKEPKRLTDKSTKAPAQSPLHRGNPSMVQMTYQGIRLLATLNPAKFAVLPFQESAAHRCSMIEVYPRDFLKSFQLPDTGYKSKGKKDDDDVLKVRRQIIAGLSELRERKLISIKELVRISISKEVERVMLSSDHAIDAVIASYLTALYTAAPQLFTDPFDSDDPNVLLEGWIYSLKPA